MSTLDEKLEQRQSVGGPARRSYASLRDARGGIRSERRVGGRVVLEIRSMDQSSFWQHDGAGRYNAAGAMYERVEEAS